MEQSCGTHAWYWKCLCDCGKVTISRPRDLIVGKQKSCGCQKAFDIGERRRDHGENKTRLHKIWVAMRMRCHDVTSKNYGGRGITVCEEWETYTAFRDWALSHGYSDDLTIERIDVNGNYCPENCKWITMREQASNRRNNLRVEINGEVKTLAEWCRNYNMPYQTVQGRYRDLGWDIVTALTTPIQKGANQFTYK